MQHPRSGVAIPAQEFGCPTFWLGTHTHTHTHTVGQQLSSYAAGLICVRRRAAPTRTHCRPAAAARPASTATRRTPGVQFSQLYSCWTAARWTKHAHMEVVCQKIGPISSPTGPVWLVSSWPVVGETVQRDRLGRELYTLPTREREREREIG